MSKYYKKKKSQAAVEFLVTYGWAFLGVMISVAALVYFGVFDTDKYVKDSCDFGNQLSCEDYILSGDDLTVLWSNNFGTSIDIVGYSVINDFNDNTAASGETTSILPGFIGGKIVGFGENFPVGEKVKFSVTVTFRRTGSPVDHTLKGTVVVTAQ